MNNQKLAQIMNLNNRISENYSQPDYETASGESGISGNKAKTLDPLSLKTQNILFFSTEIYCYQVYLLEMYIFPGIFLSLSA